MYKLLDTAAAIREVQKFLHVISDRVNPAIPRVAIDGIYGRKTAESVNVFQQTYGLEANGIVDRTTFDLLFLLFDDARKKRNTKNYIITEDGFPLKFGSQGKDVISLHLYISELGGVYDGLDNVGRGSFYNENTVKAVTDLQKIFVLEPTGETDAFLFQRILTEIDAIRRLEEIYE
ncbi:MAG: hypothetical protein E7612_06355 [Ruminococcaceae bacterium]|nr:hypothetical protein [Oscillospiraceae bacterium]